MIVAAYDRLAPMLETALLYAAENEFGVQPLDTLDYVAWENAPFVVPPPVGTFSGFWAKVEIDWRGLEQMSFGAGNRYKLAGEAVVTLFAPANNGDAFTLTKAGILITWLTNKTSGIVRTFNASHRPILRDGAWWSVEVVVPFEAIDSFALPASSYSGTADLLNWHNAIRSRVNTVCNIENVPVAYDNAPFTPTANALWVNCLVIDRSTTQQKGGSSPKKREQGIVRLVLNAPINTGVRATYTLADSLVSSFRAVSVSKVRYGVPQLSALGRSGSYWVEQLDVPYTVEEVI